MLYSIQPGRQSDDGDDDGDGDLLDVTETLVVTEDVLDLDAVAVNDDVALDDPVNDCVGECVGDTDDERVLEEVCVGVGVDDSSISHTNRQLPPAETSLSRFEYC